MSAELVDGDDGHLWVITGTPQDGYSVHQVGPAVRTFDRKFVARRAIRFGTVHDTEGET